MMESGDLVKVQEGDGVYISKILNKNTNQRLVPNTDVIYTIEIKEILKPPVYNINTGDITFILPSEITKVYY